MLLIQTLLTEKQLDYDSMLRSCSHLEGRELRLRQEAMDELAGEIQTLRAEVQRKTNVIISTPRYRG